MAGDFLFEAVLKAHNPWWEGHWGRLAVPTFRRSAFRPLWKDLHGPRQIVSLTGPRRIGKTRLQYQMIRALIDEERVDPRRVVYLDLGDPELLLGRDSHPLQALVDHFPLGPGRGRGSLHVFLDEVQKCDRWELYLKKFHDQNLPVRWMITGSASSPIFRKSRESLLGRIKDHRLLPFSFKEFVQYRHRDDPAMRSSLQGMEGVAGEFLGGLDGGKLFAAGGDIQSRLTPYRGRLEEALKDYLLLGGFPETWDMPTLKDRQDYLWDNQVQKVIHEDLVLTTSFRKPKNIERFFLHLLTRPGREIALDRVSSEIQVNRLMLERYLPLLELTDLVKTVQRFTTKPLRAKRGAFKAYLVDLGLANAVLKAGPEVFADAVQMGYYAENAVFSALLRWRRVIEISYQRERDKEVDFVVTLSAGRHLPIEVKYTAQRPLVPALTEFLERHRQPAGIVVTRQAEWRWSPPVLEIPLVDFLLLFDDLSL